MRLFILSAIAFFYNSAAFAQEKAITVKKTTDFAITGDGSDNAWGTTAWHMITQRNSNELKNAGWYITENRLTIADIQYQTRFKILYSDKGIYCLYECQDSLITATIKEDFGDLFNEDVVEAFFWPDTAQVVYFEYELSPRNYELPLIIFNKNGNANGWLPFYYRGGRRTVHAVKLNTAGAEKRFTWTAEFFIPYALLSSLNNMPPAKGSTWRANFYRIDYDREPVYSSWQLTRGSYHDPEKFGLLQFE